MMTDTRTRTWPNHRPPSSPTAEISTPSPQNRTRPPLRQPRVNAPFPSGASDREPERCEHRNQQFPDPRGTPFRNPKATEKQKSHDGSGPGQQTDDQQDTK